MNAFVDLKDQQFGSWTVISRSKTRRDTKFLCRCICGTERPVAASALKGGRTLSCGCSYRLGLRKHPDIKTTYTTWGNMLSRCENPNAANYARYGGKGVSVCGRWHAFVNFLDDMGRRPVGHTLDRVDSRGLYSPENCRWATAKEQAQNRNSARGERSGSAKLTEDAIREIRNLLATETGTAVAARYGVGITAISCIKHRKTWAHVP